MRGQNHALAALYPRGKTPYPLYRRLGGPQGRSGQVRKISPPPGFDPQTVQPVASHITDYATRPTLEPKEQYKFGDSFSQWQILRVSTDLEELWELFWKKKKEKRKNC